MRPIMVVGATGMLGQALVAEAKRRHLPVVGAGRSGPDLCFDLADSDAVALALDDVAPGVVINAAALVDIAACEADPGMAYTINARGVALLSDGCRRIDARLVQISTDHFFSGDGAAAHTETAPVRLMNEYARSKFAGEAFALSDASALVLRTVPVGLRGDADRPTFAEWALRSIQERQPITLFDDAYFSPIHVRHFATAAFDLAERRARGLFNLAGAEVVSKKLFIERLAATQGVVLDWARTGSVRGLRPERAESLGLDVSRVEALLDRPMVGADAAAELLAAEYHEGRAA